MRTGTLHAKVMSHCCLLARLRNTAYMLWALVGRGVCTFDGLVLGDFGAVEPLPSFGMEYIALLIIFRKYAEGLTADSRLPLRSCLAAESCSWGDRLLYAFQQPFTAAEVLQYSLLHHHRQFKSIASLDSQGWPATRSPVPYSKCSIRSLWIHCMGLDFGAWPYRVELLPSGQLLLDKVLHNSVGRDAGLILSLVGLASHMLIVCPVLNFQ